MSNFSEQLKVALDVAELTQAQLSAATGFPQSSISRYLKGEFAPPVDAFGTLLDALPLHLHYELIVARLADELPKKYRDSVTILSQGGPVREEDQASYLPRKLAPDLKEAIVYLAEEAVQQPAVRELLLGLARALGQGK